jgi:hypothetical protein
MMRLGVIEEKQREKINGVKKYVREAALRNGQVEQINNRRRKLIHEHVIENQVIHEDDVFPFWRDEDAFSVHRHQQTV